MKPTTAPRRRRHLLLAGLVGALAAIGLGNRASGGGAPSTGSDRPAAAAAGGVQIYFGQFAGGSTGSFAAQFAADASRGAIVGFVPSSGEGFAVDLAPDGAGDFVAVAQVSGVGVQRTIRGHVQGGVLTGQIEQLNITFQALVLPATGTTAELVGYYHASALDTSDDGLFAIFGPGGEAMVLAVIGNSPDGATGSVLVDGGVFSAQTPDGLTITGSANGATGVIQASLVSATAGTRSFAGLRSDVARTDRLVNLSARGATAPGEGTLITGFVVAGPASKTVLVRGVGPALVPFGVTTAASDPSITMLDAAHVAIAQDDDWENQSGLAAIVAATSHVSAFVLPAGSRDAAFVASAAPGAYTTQIVAPGGGVVLAEIYDSSTDPTAEPQRLINLSTRGNVGTGEATLIGGFAIAGNSPKRVLIRGVGPTLGQFSVTGTLADPVLMLYHGDSVIFQNDDWGAGLNSAGALSDAATATSAFALQPGSHDAALLVTLAPGSYTANVVGADGTSGVALIEIYEVPEN